MNKQDKERAKCNTALGISCVLATASSEEDGLAKLKKMRAAQVRMGFTSLTSYVIDGKWYLTSSGDVHEIVCPNIKEAQKIQEIPDIKYVLQTEQFLRMFGIKAFSCKPKIFA